MNPSESPEITVQTLLALRRENDAVRLITERLGVKEMGPADHIRTKHEVKIFIQTGDTSDAETLIQKASERKVLQLNLSHRVSQTQQKRLCQ